MSFKKNYYIIILILSKYNKIFPKLDNKNIIIY